MGPLFGGSIDYPIRRTNPLPNLPGLAVCELKPLTFLSFIINESLVKLSVIRRVLLTGLALRASKVFMFRLTANHQLFSGLSTIRAIEH